VWCLSREGGAWASRINGLHSFQAEGKKFHQNLEQRTISLRQEHRQQHQQQRRRRPGRGQTNISEQLPSMKPLLYSLILVLNIKEDNLTENINTHSLKQRLSSLSKITQTTPKKMQIKTVTKIISKGWPELNKAGIRKVIIFWANPDEQLDAL